MTSAYDAAVLADNPFAYWKLNDAAGSVCADSSGGGHDLSYVGSTSIASGLLGTDLAAGDSSAIFSGTGQYATAAAASWQDSATAYSVEVWFAVSSLAANRVIVGQDSTSAGTNRRFQLTARNTGAFEIDFMAGSTIGQILTPAGYIVAGQTYHAVATYDGANIVLYINGDQVASIAYTGNLNTTTVTTPLQIGAVNSGSPFAGQIEKVALYGSTLTAARVRAHYAVGSPQAYVANDFASAGALPPQLTATTFDTTAWTTQASEPGTYDHTGWATFTAPSKGKLALTTAGSTVTPTLAVYTGTSIGALTLVASGTSSLTVDVAAGVTYRLQVGVASGQAGGVVRLQSAYRSPLDVEVLADAPMAYWKLDDKTNGTAADTSGNGRPGYYSTALTQGAPGVVPLDLATAEASITLNGSNQYVTVPVGAWMNVTNLTVEAWVKPTSLSHILIIASDDSELGGSNRRFQLRILTTGGVDGGIYYSGNNQLYASSAAGVVVVGGTYHVVMAYDGANLTIWVNGVQVAQAAGVVTMNTTTVSQDMFIGQVPISAYDFIGSIEKTALYDHALTLSRVGAHYQAGTSYPIEDVFADAGTWDTRKPLATTTQDTTGWTTETSEPGGIDHSGWMVFTPTAPGQVTFTTSGSSFTPTMAVHTGSALGELTQVGTSVTGTLTVTVRPNITYRLQVGSASGVAGGNLLVQASLKTAYDAAVLADTPMAYWPMNEGGGTTLSDASGNARHGTYTGNPNLAASGIIPANGGRPCATFDGSTQWASVANAAWQNVNAETVEAWVLMTAQKTATLICQDGTTPDRKFVLSICADGTLELTASNTTPTVWKYYPVQSPPALSLVRCHVALVFDGATLRGFVNGRLLGPPVAVSGTLHTCTGPVWIGQYGLSNIQRVQGRMEGAALYGTALSDARIAEHFTAGINPFGDGFASAMPAADDLIAASQFALTGVDTTGWGTEASEPGGMDHTGWATYTPTLSGHLTITTAGSSFTPQIAVYTGATIGALTQVGAAASTLTVPVTAGTTYRIQVGSAAGSAGGSLNLTASLTVSGAVRGDTPTSVTETHPGPGLWVFKGHGTKTADSITAP
ncbi:MAG TPA: LamG domain-containing protein [Kineosporiaceae bacterium]|nr:LamG domain-containing protein [Kineosporiaceae bacterium]